MTSTTIVSTSRCADSTRPAAAVALRPLSDATPADLRTVAAALDTSATSGHAERELLEVLHACLEHRFGAEVTLGSAGRPTGDPHDVALGRDEPDA